MTIREFFAFRVHEGDQLFIEAYDSVWNGIVYEVDDQGVTFTGGEFNDWISYDDMEEWERLKVLVIKLNGETWLG